MRYDVNNGYRIVIVGEGRYIGMDISQEELESVECALDPVIDAITYLRDKWVGGK
jgi:hypothetical protein